MGEEVIVGFLEKIEYHSNSIKLIGWAKHPFKNEVAEKVVICDERKKRLAEIKPNKERPDVTKVFNDSNLLMSGWEVFIDNEKVLESNKIMAYIQVDGKVFNLKGVMNAKVKRPKMFVDYDLDELIKRGLKVGKNFAMQPDCFIDYSHCWLISIGDDVIFAPRVHVIAHDGSTRRHLGYTKIGLVEIGNRVFVGNNTIILPGVKIGDDAIIGAGSVVTKDVPAGCVYAGNPAKFICKTEDYLKKQRNLLEEGPVFSSEYKIENGITPEKKEEMIRKLKEAGGKGFLKS